MKKTFSLKSDKHKPARVLESIKADVNKYFARERRKPFPEGVDYWDFDCRCGKDSDSAIVVRPGEMSKAIDQVIADGSEVVYVEILAKPGVRTSKRVRPAFKKPLNSEDAEDSDMDRTDEEDDEEFDDDWDEDDLDEEELEELEELDQKSKKKNSQTLLTMWT